MTPSLITALSFGGALVLIALRVPIAYALLLAAVSGLLFIYGWSPDTGLSIEAASRPLISILGDIPFHFVHSYELSTIPLYLLVGTLAQASGITTDIFASMRVIVGRMPGGLAISTIFGCGGFSALSGSSVACAAAMGRITVPEMMDNGYSARLASGTVAVGGTLGSLIPPSIAFLIFAILAEQSVGRLLMAGIVPGLLTLLGYIITILVWVKLRPEAAPAYTAKPGRAELFEALWRLWPAALILTIIIGGILSGLFTTIQSAAVSVVVVIAIGAAQRRLPFRSIMGALNDAVVQSAVIFVMAFGAKLLITLVAISHLPDDLLAWASSMGFEPWAMMAIIVVTLLVMGMFLDPTGILLLMVPITLPIVEGMGFDLIWYAVIFVKMLEIGLITPPVGLNAFVVKAAVPHRYGIDFRDVFAGIAPFFILEIVVTALLLAFPVLSLFIPRMM